MKLRLGSVCALCMSLWVRPAAAAVEGKPCSPEPTEMNIAYGELIDCEILPVGDSDIFRFTASAGERIIVVVTTKTGGNSCIELLDPTGGTTPNGGKRCGSAPRIEETTANPGAYSVLVESSSTSTYALNLDRIVPLSPSAVPICNACTVEDEINGVGDVDVYAFTGSPGDSIVITATSQLGGSACIELFGPAGNQTTQGVRRCGFSTRIDETIADPGIHTVLMGSSSTANYAITLQCTGNCPPPPTVCPLTRTTAASKDSLRSVYRFRDSVMAQNETGREWMRLFYRHANEGSILMLRHPELRQETEAVLTRVRPYLDRMVTGEAVWLSRDDEDGIVSLMQAFYRKASPELRTAILSIFRELRSGRLLTSVHSLP